MAQIKTDVRYMIVLFELYPSEITLNVSSVMEGKVIEAIEIRTVKRYKVADIVKQGKQIHWNMSSEAEKGDPPAKKAENGVHLRDSTSTCLKENWPTVLKIVELVFTIFCLGLVVDPVNYGRLSQNNLHHVAVIFTAYGGYTIINLVFIICRTLGERPGWKTSVIFSLVGAVIYVAAAAVIISDWTKYMYNHIFHPSKHYMDMFISSGVFAIFTAVIYVIDAIFTYREEP